MKKILFLVNGLGLGNSIRIYALIERLNRDNVEYHVITSGNGKWFFSNLIENNKLNFIEPINYGSMNKKLSVFKTFFNIPSILKTINLNFQNILDIINKFKPDVIVTDSVYLFPKIKKISIPIVAINNADLTVDYFKKFDKKPFSIYPQFYGVEKLDYMYHKFIPDLVISPCFLNRDIIETRHNKKIKRVGPIVRIGVKKKVDKKLRNGAIMLSGSNFGVNVNLKIKNQPFKLDIIGREKPQNWNNIENVKFHGKLKNNIDLLNTIDFCVVNGGYSALSELFWAEIPMIIIPVNNHSEQWTNAKQIEDVGCGVMASEDNYEEEVLKLKKNYEMFCENFKKQKIDNNGAEEAIKLILNI